MIMHLAAIYILLDGNVDPLLHSVRAAIIRDIH